MISKLHMIAVFAIVATLGTSLTYAEVFTQFDFSNQEVNTSIERVNGKAFLSWETENTPIRVIVQDPWVREPNIIKYHESSFRVDVTDYLRNFGGNYGECVIVKELHNHGGTTDALRLVCD